MDDNKREPVNTGNRTFSVLTLGCKVNTYESDALRKAFEELGLSEVPFGEEADIVVVNTCAVTAMADKKSRQMLHRARGLAKVLVATGCHAQEMGEELIKAGTADLVVGNNLKNMIPGLSLDALESLENGGNPENMRQVYTEDLSKACEYEEQVISRVAEHTRAFVKIQDGCNQFCSYCIIPYVRGRIRSRSVKSVEKEVRELAAKGCREIVLTGIHLSSYGNETQNASELKGDRLAELVLALDGIEGIDRIRLGSLEPRVVTEEFAEQLAKAAKLCPHFHLSLQSGSDGTLKRMNRKYGAKDYKEACDILRRVFDRPSLNTDIIVGFPGETEEEHKESLEFCRSIGFSRINVFKYSRRKGTAADRMKDQVPEPVKTARSKEFIELDLESAKAYRKQFEGEKVMILTEDLETVDGKQVRTGYSERYLKYAVDASVPGNCLTEIIQ